MPAHRDVVVMPLDSTELQVLYDVRRELDGFAAWLAATNHDQEDAERMTAACADLRAGAKTRSGSTARSTAPSTSRRTTTS